MFESFIDSQKLYQQQLNLYSRRPNNKYLFQANHVNTAAMFAALKPFGMNNETWMEDDLIAAVRLLKQQRGTHNRPPSCQQVIVLITDSLYDNHTALMRQIDPQGKIR